MVDFKVGGSWRAEAAVLKMSGKVSAPTWLTSAKTLLGTKSFSPTAIHIASLAENLLSLNLSVKLNLEPITAEGLLPRLGTISRSDAYRTLVLLGEQGFQKERIVLNLEDAVAKMKARAPMDVEELGIMFLDKIGA